MKDRKNQARGLDKVSHLFLSEPEAVKEKVTIQVAAKNLGVSKGTIITYLNQGLLTRLKEGGRIYIPMDEVRDLSDSEKEPDFSTTVDRSSESGKMVTVQKEEDKLSLTHFGQLEDEPQDLLEHKAVLESADKELEPLKFEANNLKGNLETQASALEGTKAKLGELERDQQERLAGFEKEPGASDYDREDIQARLLAVEEQLKCLSRPWWQELFGNLRRLQTERSRNKGMVLLGTLALMAVLIFSVWWSNRSPKQIPSAVTEGQASGSGTVQATSQAVWGSELQQEQAAGVVQQPSEPLQATVAPEPAAVNARTSQPHGSSIEGSPFSEKGVSPLPEAEQRAVELSPTLPPYILRAETLATTWLQVVIDESQELEYLLQPDENHTWRAMSGFSLHIGNAAGLQLYLNDQSLKPLGESGEVVHLQLPDPALIVPANAE